MEEIPETNFVLSKINLVSEKWEVIGTTSQELIANEIARRLNDDKQYVIVNEVPQFESLELGLKQLKKKV
jgi:hypothetical protein